MIVFGMIPYNTLVVGTGVAAVGLAAGVVGGLGVLRRRALVGDAAAHATLVGVASAFLLTGRRELVVLLVGGLCSALAALGVLVLLRKWSKTREDAATAIVLAVSYGLGIAVVAGITARGIAGGAGLEQFLLGHTAALTAADAILLAAVSTATVVAVGVFLKEATLVAFDAAYAAATGWPVTAIDYALVVLVAVMVVAGLPAAGAVLVTALVVIPPVAARLWTDRVGTMLAVSGGFGILAALTGVAVSAAVPRLATGPLVVLTAGAIFAVSFLVAPRRGWWARARLQHIVDRSWQRGRMLSAAAESADADGSFSLQRVAERLGAGGLGRRRFNALWKTLVRQSLVVPIDVSRVPDASAAILAVRPGRWRLSDTGADAVRERTRRLRRWDAWLERAPREARERLTIDLPDPGDFETLDDLGGGRLCRDTTERLPARPS